MSKKIAMVIAHTGFRDEEYWIPKEIFVKQGFEVVTVSSQKTPATSKFGKTAEVDRLLTDIRADAFDALVLIGGPGSKEYFDLPAAHRMAADFVQKEKIVSAICSAPVILARAGLLKGIKATVFPSDRETLQQSDAIYTGHLVEKDGRIITGSGPEAAEAFAMNIVAALARE